MSTPELIVLASSCGRHFILLSLWHICGRVSSNPVVMGRTEALVDWLQIVVDSKVMGLDRTGRTPRGVGFITPRSMVQVHSLLPILSIKLRAFVTGTYRMVAPKKSLNSPSHSRIIVGGGHILHSSRTCTQAGGLPLHAPSQFELETTAGARCLRPQL